MLKLSRAKFNAAEEEIRHLKQELAQRDGRIEQLEAALKLIIGCSTKMSGHTNRQRLDSTYEIARAALGEKKDGN
jgi:hypothetical protein